MNDVGIEINKIDAEYLHDMGNHMVTMNWYKNMYDFMFNMIDYDNKHAMRYVANHYRKIFKKTKLINLIKKYGKDGTCLMFRLMMKLYMAAIDQCDGLAMYSMGKFYEYNTSSIHYNVHGSCTGQPECTHCNKQMIISNESAGRNKCDKAIVKVLQYAYNKND